MKILSSILSLLGICAAAPYTNLNVDEFAKLISNKSVVILDVRTKEEFSEGHLEGAINIDVNSPDFTKKVLALNIKSDAPIAVYCRSGRRSANACEVLSKEDFKNLSNLTDGILGWIKAGKAVVKGL